MGILDIDAELGLIETAPARGGPRQAGSTLASGSTIGRYVILHSLGAGAMGQVFAGYDVQLDRKVAIKILRPDLVSTHARQRTLREAQALAKVSHPNVVQVFEVGEHDEQVFVVMEFVNGSNLREWLADKERPWRERLAAVVTAGRGLAAVHSRGLIHRDVKPGNILVGEDGRARIADFGLVRAIDIEPDDEVIKATSRDIPTSSSSALNATLTQEGWILGTSHRWSRAASASA